MEEKKKSVRYLALSDRTLKAHRNLMAGSFVGLLIQAFNLHFDKITATGIEVSQIDSSVVRLVLAIFILYHLVVYFILGFEEFLQWRLTFRDEEHLFWDAGTKEISLGEEVAGKLKKLHEKTGGNAPVTYDEAIKLIDDINKMLKTYKAHFQIFTVGAVLRFAFVDVGIPLAIGTFSIIVLLNGGWLYPLALDLALYFY